MKLKKWEWIALAIAAGGAAYLLLKKKNGITGAGAFATDYYSGYCPPGQVYIPRMGGCEMISSGSYDNVDLSPPTEREIREHEYWTWYALQNGAAYTPPAKFQYYTTTTPSSSSSSYYPSYYQQQQQQQYDPYSYQYQQYYPYQQQQQQQYYPYQYQQQQYQSYPYQYPQYQQQTYSSPRNSCIQSCQQMYQY